MIHGIPVCVNCGAFFKGTSTVAGGGLDLQDLQWNEYISQNKSECEKMKHLQCCIHFLLVIFKQVISPPPPPSYVSFMLLESLSGAAMKTDLFSSDWV